MRRAARAVSLAGLLCSLACVAVLHVVRPDLSVAAHRLSEYANGAYGWLMSTAFVALSIALAALGILWAPNRSKKNGWILSSLAFLSAICVGVSAAFETGFPGTSETIHSRASGLATVAIVILALAYTMPTVLSRRNAPFDPVAAGIAVAAAVLLGISSLLHETRWTGIGQRALWISLIAWLMRVTIRDAHKES